MVSQNMALIWYSAGNTGTRWDMRVQEHITPESFITNLQLVN